MPTPQQINKDRKSHGLPPLNFKLIRKVIKRIETVPESYAQQVWESDAEEFNESAEAGRGHKRPTPPCGSVACLAGEAIICDAPTIALGLRRLKRTKQTAHRAAQLLGLSEGETDLFDGEADGWIQPFRNQFKNAKTYKGEARAAINYLRYILRTGKVTE
jgi:hypothetical protein